MNGKRIIWAEMKDEPWRTRVEAGDGTHVKGDDGLHYGGSGKNSEKWSDSGDI